MLSELARVFSSQGVLIQGTQYAPGPRRSNATIPDSDEIGEGQRFAVEFEQASAKLELSKAAKERIAETERLARQDKDVRSHEQAHLASAGGVAKGGANFTYRTGPDGESYAVGGHVNIDASPVEGNPRATLQKAAAISRAALAPADPSGQDRAVAAAAAAMALEARKALAQEKETAGRMEYGTSLKALGTKINVRA